MKRWSGGREKPAQTKQYLLCLDTPWVQPNISQNIKTIPLGLAKAFYVCIETLKCEQNILEILDYTNTALDQFCIDLKWVTLSCDDICKICCKIRFFVF